MGELMFQSHESYSACGLGSKRTSEIVELAKQQYSPGIYGAKITGGGSGGTVCLLAVGEEGIQSAKKVHRMMEKSYNTKLGFFD
jgi:L-arabinokinase